MTIEPFVAEPILNRLTGKRQKLEKAANRLEQQPALLVGCMTLFYLLTVSLTIQKGLWFDELFTYYIAKQETVSKLLDANYFTDLNPPLLYFLVRWCQNIFGDGEVATRLPTVVGFWVGSIAFFSRLAVRTGYLVAGGAIATFWSGFFLLYAVDARPYGVWLGLFGCALYCWDIYPTTKRPHLAAAGLLLSVLGMMLTHVLAPFAILILCSGELARSLQQRKVGWLWLVLVAPMGLELAYLFWMRQFERIIFPPVYQASLARMVRFYGRLTVNLLLPFTAGAVVATLLTRWTVRPKWTYKFSGSDLAIGLAMFLMPYGIVAALARTHGAFHFRYGIVGSLVLWTICSLLLNCFCHNKPLPAAAFIFVMLATCLATNAWGHVGWPFTPQAHPALAQLKQELPLVAGSGLTFLELDHYETPAVTSRLYYLTDKEYATRYAHDTLFEGSRGLKKYFPIRGTVEPFREFVARHPHFFVLGDMTYLEDWLLKRLADDPRFNLRFVGSLSCCYKDKEIYEVTAKLH